MLVLVRYHASVHFIVELQKLQVLVWLIVFKWVLALVQILIRVYCRFLRVKRFFRFISGVLRSLLIKFIVYFRLNTHYLLYTILFFNPTLFLVICKYFHSLRIKNSRFYWNLKAVFRIKIAKYFYFFLFFNV